MERQISLFETEVTKLLESICSDADQAQLVAAVLRESILECNTGSALSRETAFSELEQALLDCEVSLTSSDINKILDSLEGDGLIGEETASAEEEAENEILERDEDMVGKSCTALMKIFDSETKSYITEWHTGVVKEVEAGEEFDSKFHVLFDQFGSLQIVSIQDIAFDEEDDSSDKCGSCPFCEREMPLTFHHLIPKATHTAMKKLANSKYLPDPTEEPTTAYLNSHGVDICRPCHSQVHRCENNLTLAQQYNTTEKLLAHPGIQRWIVYARKQKLGSLKCRR
mmetsp:Transcript_14530/g.29046  ORF Transcript_14530/g.29046 Transcript_14530/m.29046 type:complete len:284 (-) Transcript_14530:61-912(-)|eukprot:CAMPEP_0181323190 /NCGR_PEP_ID=MMETSP1101-20121128/19643_1 /TAXON_ID=46948 /ORGANISM="Rhodomonas abbreviata, Strain Caron Lab Isolate" /LENGTH=283 /DNA_ID=CAMNT_0023431181 /DNA_START=66 /DNA_END=917 /DNA_ORIENTATION=-